MEALFHYIDSDYAVKPASHAADEAASAALDTLRHNPNGSVETMGGLFTYRMRGDYPVLKFRDEYEIAYFCQDTETLENLILAFRDGVEDDFFVTPRETVGGWRRKRMLHKHTPLSWRRKRMLHKHTPLSKRSRKSKRSKRSKRARRTLRKN